MRLLLVLALLLPAVAHAQPIDRAAMCQLAGDLTRLAALVQAEASKADGRTGEQLIAAAKAKESELIQRFSPYHLEARNVAGRSSVMVCSKAGSGGRLLLEDDGCTPRFDGHFWHLDDRMECGFVLKIEGSCAVVPFQRNRPNPCR